MKPAQVLDAQSELLSRLHDRTFAGAMINQTTMDYADAGIDGKANYSAKRNAEVSIDVLRQRVQQAYAYHVTPDMETLIEFAASQLEELDRIDLRLAPTHAGFARFERPLPMVDVRGSVMKAHWLVWGPISTQIEDRESMCIWFFNDTNDPDEVALHLRAEYPESIARIFGRWSFIGTELVYQDERLGAPMSYASDEKRAKILADGDMPSPATNMARYVHAFWLMLGQTVARHEDADVGRMAARRARRAGLPGRVTVIQLRRYEDNMRRVGETLVEWSHRWVVRGGFAWRKCGEDKPGALPYEKGFRRRVWIAPYVKGPADKDLIVTDKVYTLSR